MAVLNSLSLQDLERFATKFIIDEGDHWRWQAYVSRSGYGVFHIRHHPFRAHRVIYTSVKGVIPEGLIIDHLCRVRDCVNPMHLEAVTPRENILRGNTGSGSTERSKRMTHCKNGHVRSPENIRVKPKLHKKTNVWYKYVKCLPCKRESNLKYSTKTT